MDTMSKAARSALMARIKSRRTGPEMRFHGLLKGAKIRHQMWPKLPGNPDCVILDTSTVVFVHGCYWHGCSRHFRLPKTNTAFWRKKIARNKERHAEATKELRALGFNVCLIWEHELKAGYNKKRKSKAGRVK